MVKLKAPLMSLKAQGRLSKLFSLARRQGRNIIERRPKPTDAKSPAQLFNRHMFTKCVDLWHLLSSAEQQEWESLARPRHMSGYAWYISQCLRPNPGIYLPLQGGTMSGNIDMATNRILNLLDPTVNQEAATKKYHDDNKYTDAQVAAILAIHAALITGVHGAGDSILATTLNIAQHAALPNVHHTPPVAGAVLTVAETQVYAGNSPNAWTDLDLSGTVGSQATLVLLKIWNNHASADRTYAVRKNGDTDEFYAVDKNFGAAMGDIDNGFYGVFVVATDNSGVIEWRNEGFNPCTVDIIAYIK